jgi:hypothetical protein
MLFPVAVVTLLLGFSAVTPQGSAPSVAPCETMAIGAAPSPVNAPKSPTNLRIIKEEDLGALEDDLTLSGPNAGSMDEYEGAAALQSVHSYYDALASRADCATAYSLRDAAQVEAFRRNKAKAPAVKYIYPNDPDPRRQDAMKIEIPANAISLPTQLWLPTGPGGDPAAGHGDKNLFVTWDIWWGKEFNYTNTMIHQFKGIFQFASPRDQFWLSLHTSFKLAEAHTHNQPPGGPYVTMTYPHASLGGQSVHAPSTWGASPEALRNATPPYNWPVNQEKRGYGPEMVGPLDTETYPAGQEWGVVAERWTRYWAYFERIPSLDWQSTSTKYPGTMRAFKWTVWSADTQRPVTRILNEALVAPNPTDSGSFTYLWLEMNVSAPQTAVDRMNAGRGPLTAYARNVVVLHGTSKADALKLLQRP